MKYLRARLLFLFSFLMIFLASCSGPLTMDNNGQMIEYPVDTEFLLELPAPEGALWQVADINSSVVKAIGEPKITIDEAKGEAVYEFTFKTVAPGDSPLKLFCKLKDENSSVLDSYELQIISGTIGRIEAE